jgi:hypothetical protein
MSNNSAAARRPASGPDRIDRSGAQPNSTSGANDSAYCSRRRATRRSAGEIDAVHVAELPAGEPHDGRRDVGCNGAGTRSRARRRARSSPAARERRRRRRCCAHTAVLAEGLAVVAGRHISVGQPRRAERGHQAADLAVGDRDLSS